MTFKVPCTQLISLDVGKRKKEGDGKFEGDNFFLFLSVYDFGEIVIKDEYLHTD